MTSYRHVTEIREHMVEIRKCCNVWPMFVRLKLGLKMLHTAIFITTYGKQQFNLFCFFFCRSAFARALLESKTHTRVLEILATKTHYAHVISLPLG